MTQRHEEEEPQDLSIVSGVPDQASDVSVTGDEELISSDRDPITGATAEPPRPPRGRRVPQGRLEARREQPTFEMLPAEEQTRLLRQAPIYERLLQVAAMAGTEMPPRSEILIAAEELKATSTLKFHENTVRYNLKKILNRLKPGVRIIDVLVPDNRGPEKGRYITDEQYDVILGTVLKNVWVIVDSVGNRHIKRKRFSYQWLEDVLNKPEFNNPVSRTQIVRQIQDIKLTDPILVELAQKGVKYVDTHYIDKIQIDFERPWECLQSDARALPIFVLIDGEPCICVLIVIIDAFSKYILDWLLVAKKGKDAEGDWHNVDFTGKHVREMFGNVILNFKRRPWFIYTDNGSQFRALEPYLPLLLDHGEKGLELVNTEPYRPQGRGIIERTLGITDSYICEFEGSFSKDTLIHREAAKKEKLRTFEWLCGELAYYFKNWNELDQEKNHAKSR